MLNKLPLSYPNYSNPAKSDHQLDSLSYMKPLMDNQTQDQERPALVKADGSIYKHGEETNKTIQAQIDKLLLANNKLEPLQTLRLLIKRICDHVDVIRELEGYLRRDLNKEREASAYYRDEIELVKNQKLSLQRNLESQVQSSKLNQEANGRYILKLEKQLAKLRTSKTIRRTRRKSKTTSKRINRNRKKKS